MDTSRALFIAAFFLALGHGEAQFAMRWCTKSGKENDKCNAMKAPMEQLASDYNMSITFSCLQDTSAANCMGKIKSGQADLITLDGGEINTAGGDLVPVVGEDYGAGYGISYKAVAAVKTNKDITLETLKEKKSCHTGAGKTAGWNVPIGTLLRMGIMMPDKSCNAYVAASKFFYKSCVPRVKEVNKDNSYDLDNLCALCRNECSIAIKGEYSDYDGAFRCLQDDAGDVAFIKHTTIKDNASNYEYLCTDGSRKPSPDNCFLAEVPSHAVVTKRAHDRIASYKQLLVKASEIYGVNQTNSSMFQLFNSSKYDGNNLLFKDSTEKLVDVGDRNTYEKWLGEAYLEDLKALNMCPKTPSPSKATTVGSHSYKPQLFVAMVFFFAMVISGVLFE